MTTTTERLEEVPAAAGAATAAGRAGRRRRPEHRLAAVLLVLAVWQAIPYTGGVLAELVPSPWEVARETPGALGDEVFWQMLGATLQGALQGFVAALAIGIPVGLIMGRVPFVERSTRMIVDFGRSFPTIALLPVFLLVFGTSMFMKSLVVFLAAVWPVLVQTTYGARRIDPAVEDTARAYRIPPLMTYTHVILPTAIPFIATGIRLAATKSVLVAVGVEVLASVDGIGRQISNLQNDGQTAAAYVCILAGGLLGYGINRGVQALELRLLRWRPPVEGE